MPVTLTDDNTVFPAVTAPVNSDALGTVDIRAGLQAVANRTAYLRNSTVNGAFTLARLDGTAKLPATNVHNGVIDLGEQVRTGVWGAADTNSSSTTMIDGPLSFGVSFAEVGDLLEITLVSVTTVDGGHPGEMGIRIVEGDGSNVDPAVALSEIPDTTGTAAIYNRVTCTLLYTVAHAGTVTVKQRYRNKSAGNAYLVKPSQLRVKRFRP